MNGFERAAPTTVPQALGRLRVALEDAYTRASRELGLTSQQAELLCAALSPASVGDLAEVLRCDRSNVSRLVDRASASGLLRRRPGPDDGRVTLIELSPSGRRLTGRFIAALEAQTRALLEAWPAQRGEVAIAILNEIADELDAARQRPRPGRRGRSRDRQTSPRAAGTDVGAGPGPNQVDPLARRRTRGG